MTPISHLNASWVISRMVEILSVNKDQTSDFEIYSSFLSETVALTEK